MNPYRIYREEWPAALARQSRASEYATFVALPFQDTFSYRSRDVLSKVVRPAATQANRLRIAKRKFSRPERADTPMGAAVITEEIVSKILNSHFFMADVTFNNPGVLIETGIALAMKPARQVILLTQGSLSELHFDLRNNNVITYGPRRPSKKIVEALLEAANHFEEQLQHYATDVARRLGPDAIAALKWYGTVQRKHGGFSLHAGSMGPHFIGDGTDQRFASATRELRDRELLWTDYRPRASGDNDLYGMHATELGWVVIELLWPELGPSATPVDSGASEGSP